MSAHPQPHRGLSAWLDAAKSLVIYNEIAKDNAIFLLPPCRTGHLNMESVISLAERQNNDSFKRTRQIFSVRKYRF